MENKNSTLSIVGLILGIIALVLAFFGGFMGIWGYVIGLVAGVVGIILSVMGKKQAPSGMATAALVCSIIGTVICAVTFIACAACASALYCGLNQAAAELA